MAQMCREWNLLSRYHVSTCVCIAACHMQTKQCLLEYYYCSKCWFDVQSCCISDEVLIETHLKPSLLLLSIDR